MARRPPPRAARARGSDLASSLASRLGLFVFACVGFNVYVTRMPPESAAQTVQVLAAVEDYEGSYSELDRIFI